MSHVFRPGSAMVKILDHPVDTWKPPLTSWKSKGAPKKLPHQQKMPCGGVQLEKKIIFLGARKPASTPTRSLSNHFKSLLLRGTPLGVPLNFPTSVSRQTGPTKVASRALLANSKLSWNSPSLKASNWLTSSLGILGCRNRIPTVTSLASSAVVPTGMRQ